MADNLDHLLVRRFVQAPREAVPVDTSPVALDLSMRLHAWDADSGTLVLAFEPAARHLQGNGVVHGGTVATMLDFGLAFAALGWLEPPRSAATLALNVQFERPARPGPLQVTARIDRMGGRVAFASARLEDATGAVLARAMGTLALT